MRATTARKSRSRRWFLTGGAASQGADPVARIAEACLVRAGVVCQACADVCPEGWIRFQLQRGGPPLPSDCHSEPAMDFTRQSPRAVRIHTEFFMSGERTCIDCHKGIAHELPDMPGIEPGWTVPQELQGTAGYN